MRVKNRTNGGTILSAVLLAGIAATGAAAAVGCGDPVPAGTSSSSSSSSGAAGEAGAGGSSSSSSSSSGAAGMGGMGGSGGAGGGMGGAGGSGGGMNICATTAGGELRGSAIAITPDDKHLVSVNRDVGTVTISSVDYGDGQPKLTKVAELLLGDKTSEPWQVVIDACGERAYVITRKEQKVYVINGISTASPTIGAGVSVGSEPTGIVISPNNATLYVANWVDGTVSVVDAQSMSVTSTINLNAALAGSGLLGANVTPRPALAHPRSLAITNDGDADDTDEKLYVTEWFAQRTGPETVMTTDTNKKGLVYAVDTADSSVSFRGRPSTRCSRAACRMATRVATCAGRWIAFRSAPWPSASGTPTTCQAARRPGVRTNPCP